MLALSDLRYSPGSQVAVCAPDAFLTWGTVLDHTLLSCHVLVFYPEQLYVFLALL